MLSFIGLTSCFGVEFGFNVICLIMFNEGKMVFKFFNLLKNLIRRYRGEVVFVNYYQGTTNVGDLLHFDIVEHYLKKEAVKPPLVKYFKHILMVGSIIDAANKNSTLLGCGSNDPLKLKKHSDFGVIKALRGVNTKNIVESQLGVKLDIPLGDFGLLFPRVYSPEINVKHKFGLILHYVDVNHAIASLVDKMGGVIISVRQNPKSFIDEIKSCESILSSSMHGCILSDAYNIRNKRIILSDNITGADFKFSDYYSVTNNPLEQGIVIGQDCTELEIENALNQASVKSYIYSLDELEKTVSQKH